MTFYQDSGDPANEQLKRLRLLNETASKISNALIPNSAVSLGGAIITEETTLSLLIGSSTIKSFTVKNLDASALDFSWDNGVTWNTNILDGFSQGKGNILSLNITGLKVRPTVLLDRVLITWEK